MGKKLMPALLLLIVVSMSALAQDTESTVEVNGLILDEETLEPVEARVFYESLPYGNKVGVLNSSTFTFKLEDGKSYTVSVKANGYLKHNATYDPNMMVDGVITDTLYLAPTLDGKLIRLESLIFARGNDHIPASAYPELDRFVALMKENPQMLIQLEGHTDYRGDAKKNMELSESRVNATKDYFLSKGIDKKRIAVVAFGGSKPVMRSNDPESYKLNRRVELRVTQM